VKPRDLPKLPKLTEKQFQDQVIQMARLCGWWAYHTHDARHSQKGLPDLILAKHAVIWAELKVPPRKATPEQTACLERLRAAGQRAYLWTPADWLEIERVLREGP
jgi:hypothetical protein